MSRGLTFSAIATLDEAEARALFIAVRWPDGPYCPRCASKNLYLVKRDGNLDCADCDRRFSETSGTAFQSRKLSFCRLLQLAYLFATRPKGIASIQAARMVGVQQKTAYLLFQKMREAMQAEIATFRLTGQVEVDGAVFGGYRFRQPSPNNPGGKFRYIPRGKRQIVVALKERGGPCIPIVVRQESQAIFAVRRFVGKGAEIHVDGAHAWDSLARLHHLSRVDHNRQFVDGPANTNSAESFFAMLRRGHIGVYHRIGGDHLALYAAEAAWRNAHRDKEVQFADLLSSCCRQISERWRGYYQRESTEQSVSLPAAVAALSPPVDFAANRASWPAKSVHLVRLVQRAVAKSVPQSLRDDVAQDVLAGVVTGEWHRSNLAEAIKHFRRINGLSVTGSFLADVSLDEPITDSGLKRLDLVQSVA